MSVSGLILPKAVFDLHVSVSCLFGPKDADHLSDHVHGKILGTVSVSGFIPENSQFELSVWECQKCFYSWWATSAPSLGCDR